MRNYIIEMGSIESNKTEPQYLAGKELGRLNQRYEKGHPRYATSIEEDIEYINAVTVDALKAYHKEFYGIIDVLSIKAFI